MPGCYAVFHKQLGDLLLLQPALSRLRDFHGPPVRLMTRNGHAPLVSLMEGVELQRGLPFIPQRALYCFDPLNKSALRSAFAPVLARRCILPEAREMRPFHRLVFRDVIVPELGDSYVAEYFWAHTRVPASAAFRPPRLSLPPAAWRPSSVGDAPFILLNPTSGWRKKSWLAAGWIQVITALQEQTGLAVFMTSATTDWQIEHCREIAQGAPGVRSLPRTSLEQFLWLCSRADLVLTVDGAASHLAAAFGRRSLTLFGPTNRHNWHSPAPDHVALQAPPSRDGICRLRDLPAAGVLAAARALVP